MSETCTVTSGFQINLSISHFEPHFDIFPSNGIFLFHDCTKVTIKQEVFLRKGIEHRIQMLV